MLRTALFAVLMAPLWPAALAAQEVGECDWRASAANLAEPWEENTRVYANGAVRLAVIDTVEPAAAAFHLLILSPPLDELGLPQCRLLSAAGGSGFAALSLDGMEAGYDPATGLNFVLASGRYTAEGLVVPTTLSVTLNQATGQITGQLD
ncbi:hypothetical protein ACSBLW_17070 [Thioclava sp. FR2]|uniref:hypothetical protein n=1 Tax=Thioclava sp. FR2 TaxID=3445780 RepID=UPI003EB99DB2